MRTVVVKAAGAGAADSHSATSSVWRRMSPSGVPTATSHRPAWNARRAQVAPAFHAVSRHYYYAQCRRAGGRRTVHRACTALDEKDVGVDVRQRAVDDGLPRGHAGDDVPQDQAAVRRALGHCAHAPALSLGRGRARMSA